MNLPFSKRESVKVFIYPTVKTSQTRKPWVYLIVGILVLALIGFSFLPLLTNFFRAQNVSSTRLASFGQATNVDPEELETQAKGLEMVLEREPDNVTTLKSLVEVRLQQGLLEQAIVPMEKLAKLEPEQPDYMLLLGQAKEQVGDDEGAFEAYEEVLKNRPGYIKGLQSMVALLLKNERPERAIGLLEETLKSAPQANISAPGSVDVPSIQMLLGRVYEYQKDFTSALAIYDKVIEDNDKDFRPLWYKAEILKNQEQLEDAGSLYSQALTLAPAKYKDSVKNMAGDLLKEETPNNENTKEKNN